MVLALILLNILIVFIAIFKVEWIYKSYLYIRVKRKEKKNKKVTIPPKMDPPREVHNSYSELMKIIDTVIMEEWKVNEQSYLINNMDTSIHVKNEITRMTKNVLDSLAPGILHYLSFYVSREHLQVYIVRKLSAYLADYTQKKMKERLGRSNK